MNNGVIALQIIATIGSILTVVWGFYELGFKPQFDTLCTKFDTLLKRFKVLENRVNENTQKITELDAKVDMMCKQSSFIDPQNPEEKKE